MNAGLKPAIALAGAVLVGVPIAAAFLLRSGSGAPASGTTAPVTTASAVGPHFPAPPDGAVVYSRQLGKDALALGVVPQHGAVLAQASVVGQQGEGISGLRVTFVVQGATKAATACGSGCYHATLATKGRPPSVDVVLRGAQSTHWHVALPAAWPPPDGARTARPCRRRVALASVAQLHREPRVRDRSRRRGAPGGCRRRTALPTR